MDARARSSAIDATKTGANNFEKAGRWSVLVGVGLLFIYAVYLVTGLTGEPWVTIFEKGVFDLVLLSSAVACFMRAASTREDRAIWIAFGVGSLMEACGIFYHQFVLAWDATPPYPSPQDAFYLLVYPGWYIGLVLLARRHLSDRRLSLWLHGVIGGLTCAALAAALVFDKVVSTAGASTAAIATNLAYPVADTMLLALLVCIVALTGTRTGLKWGLICAGVGVFYAADIQFALQIAAGTFRPGTLLDILWPAGMLLIAGAGYVRGGTPERFRNEARWMLLPATIFAGTALGIVTYGHTHDLHPAAVWMAAGALGVLIVQFLLATLENAQLLGVSRHEAKIDQVTGLPNRRQLFIDLAEACANATSSKPALVLMFDLNGFKAYNDRFGHMAGDVLLKRLGARLSEDLSAYGRVYRLGGDEFCALAQVSLDDVDSVTEIALGALTDRGEGFGTSASCGSAVIPFDTTSADEAMRLADQRMYAQKHGDGSLDSRQFDTVIRVIQRFAPMIDTHCAELLTVVRETALASGMSDSEAAQISTAFEVRDVGYYAVPGEILHKQGPLDDAEWALMKTHPVVGERLLAISPTLRTVGSIVRASHERIDGDGYPDALAGAEIPLGARVVAVAAAFDAMVSQRPYRAALTVDQALAEIKRGAGTQFDVEVVATFCAVLDRVDFELVQRAPVLPQGSSSLN